MRLAIAALILGIPHAASAAEPPALDISGDVRLRLEQDWDSQTETGVKREERTRARFRARLNAKADLGDGFILRGRVRTTGESPQSANITFADFDGNPEDDLKILVDRYSLAWQHRAVGIEAGRMAFPFFTPNEYLWHNDVAVLGLSGNLGVPLTDAAKLKFSAGAFKLLVGPARYSGKLIAGQAVLERGLPCSRPVFSVSLRTAATRTDCGCATAMAAATTRFLRSMRSTSCAPPASRSSLARISTATSKGTGTRSTRSAAPMLTSARAMCSPQPGATRASPATSSWVIAGFAWKSSPSTEATRMTIRSAPAPSPI
ncbi:putative porin [Novosphingobium sp. ES2-1]|nr:putative porin [Novosphingobium sp. ES2-1]